MKVTDAFLGEHAVLYRLFLEIESRLTAPDLATLQTCAALIADALVSHAQLENELLFDNLESSLRDEAVFAVMREEHAAIEELLAKLPKARSAEHAAELLFEIIQLARDHFRKEEMVAFPLAEQTVGSAALDDLGDRWAISRGVTG